jgi:hypothetical protein
MVSRWMCRQRFDEIASVQAAHGEMAVRNGEEVVHQGGVVYFACVQPFV